MPYKDPEKQKAAQKRHYQRNAELYKKRGVNRKTQIGYHNTTKTYKDLPDLVPTLHDQILLGGWETTDSISKKYGIHQTSIKNAIRVYQTLPGFKLGMYWVVEPDDAEFWFNHRYQNQPRPVRKPEAPFYKFLKERRRAEKIAEEESKVIRTPRENEVGLAELIEAIAVLNVYVKKAAKMDQLERRMRDLEEALRDIGKTIDKALGEEGG